MHNFNTDNNKYRFYLQAKESIFTPKTFTVGPIGAETGEN